jgi:cytoskeleton protein RodZ
VCPESLITPLGETLQRARLARGVTLEEAERTTRISHRYLEALENENFGLLPAPVYARGFLRTYARYLGLEPTSLLPLFPVGYLDVPLLEPMPRVTTPRTWPGSGLLAAGVVGMLLIVVVGLYALGGSDGNSPSLFGPGTLSPEARLEGTPQEGGAVAPITMEPALTTTPAAVATAPAEGGTPTTAGTPAAPPVAPPAGTMPDLRGQTLADASATLRSLNVDYLAVQVPSDVPAGQVIRQSVSPGSEINPDQVVTLEISRGP